MPAGLLLLMAIFFEVAGTILMKISDGFVVIWASILMIVCYGISFGSLTLCLRQMPVSVAYAIWSGLGTVIIAVVGMVFFKESVNEFKLICLGLMIVGVIGLNFSED